MHPRNLHMFLNAFFVFITRNITLKTHVEVFETRQKLFNFFIKIHIDQYWHSICWYSIQTGKEEKNLYLTIIYLF